MSLSLVGLDVPADPLDEADAYLAVSLSYPDDGEKLYCYFEQRDGGPNGGYIELGVSAVSGKLASIVAITVPVASGDFPPDGLPAARGVPVLNLEDWANLDSDPRMNFIRKQADLSLAERGSERYYALGESRPVRWVESGKFAFGIGGNDELAGFLVRNEQLVDK